jgi:hypothetical protein
LLIPKAYMNPHQQWLGSMEELSVVLLLKAFLRVAPTFIFLSLPMNVPLILRAVFSMPLALILSQRLAQNYVTLNEASISFADVLVGVTVGVFISVFFSASMKVSMFFVNHDDFEEESESPWRKIVDSFLFISIIMLFMALKLEKNVIEVLAIEKVPAHDDGPFVLWAAFLTDVSWLALKVSSFGFVFSLTKSLFEEIYRRLGGESLRIVFSVCAWVSLLIMAPFLIPSFASFLSGEMSEFWNKWLGATS